MKKSICVCLFCVFCAISSFSLTHTVEKGETLYGISRKYGITVNDLCSVNDMTTRDVLKAGQVLKIPTNEKPDTYIVQKGDTLYSISKKFGVNVETLTILNKMSGSDIQAGQTIYVPMATIIKSDDKNADITKPITSSSTASNNSEELEDLTLTDSRTYDKNKSANKNLKWPVSPKEIQYVKGKVNGVAIVTNTDEDVKSISGGTVMFCGVYRGFGNVVFVENAGGYMYVYSNLSKITVNEGDKIVLNQNLGKVAMDTRAQKPQLLLMVFKNGNPVDPAKAPRS